MFGLLKDGNLIGIHDEEEVVKKCLDMEMYKNATAIKIKKKTHHRLERYTFYRDIYLIRFGDVYIPYYLYQTYRNEGRQYLYDMRYCKDVLIRLMEDKTMNRKDEEAFERVLQFINQESASFDLSIETAAQIKLMNDEYHERLTRD